MVQFGLIELTQGPSMMEPRPGQAEMQVIGHFLCEDALSSHEYPPFFFRDARRASFHTPRILIPVAAEFQHRALGAMGEGRG